MRGALQWLKAPKEAAASSVRPGTGGADTSESAGAGPKDTSTSRRSFGSPSATSSTISATEATRAAFAYASPVSQLPSASPSLSPSPLQPATPSSPVFIRSLFSDRAASTSKPVDITPVRGSFSLSRPSSAEGVAAQSATRFTDSELFLRNPSDVDMASGFDAAMSALGRGRQDSFVSAGPRPIHSANPNRDGSRARRESVAGSQMGGMSWGGISVGSFIRDDIMMGTSPLNMHQSPSFHSSSYIPKLEANFMRDFYCCQQIFPDLHALLQHYEEFHHTALQSANKAFPAPAVGPSQFSVAKASAARPLPAAGQPSAAVQASTSTAQSQAQVQRPFTQQPHTLQGASTMAQQMPRQQQQQQSQGMTHTTHAAGQKGNMAYSTLDEMATIGEMELDDPIGTMELEDVPQQQKLQQTRQMFGARPQLQINSADLAQQALRTSTPTTPAAANFGFQHNPTVSSVNTPTMTTHSQQRQAQYAQAPNVGLDGDYNAFTGSLAGQYPIAFGNGDMALDVSTIDDPAKRLFSSGGNLNAANQRKAMHQLHQLQLDPSQLPAVDPQQALLLSQMNGLMMPEEVKPFKCPVIGCEKAYKNQNGLKYHKSHGHSNQQLHDNADGTFSIVDPETREPYPGTVGMEKEKPFACDVCGKRYKNLNGLKYHKQHSVACDPNTKMQQANVMAAYAAMAGIAFDPASTSGLPNIGEDSIM